MNRGDDLSLLEGYHQLEDEAASVWYVCGADASVESTLAELALVALREGIAEVNAYFALARPFPRVRAVLVPNRSEFDRLVRDLLRVEIERPSHPARIAQPQRTDLVALSPTAYAAHSPFTYAPDAFKRLLQHELVHMVEEHISPNIEAGARWWSEGLAIWLSQQWRYDEAFWKTAVAGVTCGEIPTFAQIETEVAAAYDWGWTLVRYIECVYGRETIVHVVKTCSDGDVCAAIGVDAAQLESAWRRWLPHAVAIHAR